MRPHRQEIDAKLSTCRPDEIAYLVEVSEWPNLPSRAHDILVRAGFDVGDSMNSSGGKSMPSWLRRRLGQPPWTPEA